MKRSFTKYPSGYVKASSDKHVTKALRRKIYDFCDELGGYADYDDKIDLVMEEFGLSRKEAENQVWNWSIHWQG